MVDGREDEKKCRKRNCERLLWRVSGIEAFSLAKFG